MKKSKIVSSAVDQHIKRYREKDIVRNVWEAVVKKNVEFIENGNSKLILPLILFHRDQIILVLRRTGKFALFSH